MIFKLCHYHLLQAANAHIDFRPDLGLYLHFYQRLRLEFTHIPSLLVFLLQNRRRAMGGL